MHSGSMTKNKIQISARNCLDMQIHKDSKGHTSPYSSIKERRDLIPLQLGHLVRYTDVLTDGKQSITQLKTPCNLYCMFGSQTFGDNCFSHQTNSQVKKFNKTVVVHLRNYVAKHQTDWDHYLQSLTYSYNAYSH